MGLCDAFTGAQRAEGPDPLQILSPATGRVVRMADIPDPVFSEGMMGVSVGIWPDDDEVRCPVDGTVTAAMPHAYGISTPGGVEIIVHVGVDTVEMRGEGFDVRVAKGRRVLAGQTLVRVDRGKVAQAGYPDVVILAVSNTDELVSSGRAVRDVAPAHVTAGDVLMEVTS
ncbi:PTS sugar transporter subunit IIA [Olsenella massiliensis]|uniref:PTS sugar transporter subunit IIA n=1 Tax=Olsenella massiliensis TaxID=1622075 RepID=UPI00071C4091|nr:PTS glucose transporter subunit IIA [Olsenella massiliensis]